MSGASEEATGGSDHPLLQEGCVLGASRHSLSQMKTSERFTARKSSPADARRRSCSYVDPSGHLCFSERNLLPSRGRRDILVPSNVGSMLYDDICELSQRVRPVKSNLGGNVVLAYSRERLGFYRGGMAERTNLIL